MRIAVLTILTIMLLGCSESRKECLLKGIDRMLPKSVTTLGNCWTYGYDACQVKDSVYNYIASTPLKEIEMPFICYAALKFEPERFPCSRKDEIAKFLFQWGGAMATRNQPRGYASSPNLCFTFFMLTSNDVTRVLAFDLGRNRYNRSSYGSDYYDYVRGVSWLSIWDGHLNDLDKPEEIFSEQYKDVFAVMTDRLFNYDSSPWATDFQVARKIAGRKRLYRLVWRTKECMLFLPDVLFNTSGEGHTSVRQR